MSQPCFSTDGRLQKPYPSTSCAEPWCDQGARKQVMRPLCLWQAGDEGGDLFRWDATFLKPASRVGELAFEKMRKHLNAARPTPVALIDAGDTLVIDNWRMLHSRPPIAPGREDRQLARVYLERLH